MLELAIIIHDGLSRMYCNQEDLIYYLTVTNETYPMPPLPKEKNIRDGILKGLYRFRGDGEPVKLLGSGAIMNEVLAAQALLERDFDVTSEVWAATSYQQLHREALERRVVPLDGGGARGTDQHEHRCEEDGVRVSPRVRHRRDTRRNTSSFFRKAYPSIPKAI